jgi:UDP:flavonoid glycosyltransferase YjiC (YdhE family)
MNENGIRLAWSGAGLMIRGSLAGPRAIRWAVAELLEDGSFRDRAGEIAAWSRTHNGPETGALSIEALVG